jgi:molybdopterin synthase catalytic subunit
VHCRIASDPIDPQQVVQHVLSDADGAVVLFSGVVRDHDRERPVRGITYEAYEEMATEALTRICEDVASQFRVGDIAVVHRVGELSVGEVSVAIAVAAPHRDAAYKASREVIERLKQEVPIWKRERYADGEEEWLDGTIPCPPQGSSASDS